MLGTAVLLVFLATPLPTAAQDAPAESAPALPRWMSLGAGAAVGFLTHESGHLALDLAFGADPGLRAVDFHGIPFFAISHRSGLPRRQEFLISWAGFGTQHVTSEWLLSRRPELRRRGRPLEKGLLAFHVLCSAAYGVAAFPRTGPSERDTRGLASSARVDERWIGALVVAPAALDTYRYFHPRARWAAWTSRAMKAGLLLLVLK
jgi:hypothetical protein